ncbi:hypothetical protein HY768_06815 [candidate division TA06 bacterium]|uniref:DUF2380 domain-containing protein n=1 Tax=candidate division TA06 bacterium TaxID=2250710 RepID=A0A933MKP3_UNCT6|nr:hypothetical protein [candidate division TA06 bacterium]
MKQIMNVITMAFLLALAALPSAQAQKLQVSVMDLNVTSGLSKSEVSMLTDKLINDLVIANVYQVVDRSKRDEILKEQGFQQSGACDQGACLVEAGQLLGVQKMVGGTIGKLGAAYYLQLRVIDVKTGGIDRAFSKSYSGDISLLLEGMREAASYFSGVKAQPAPAAAVLAPPQPQTDTSLAKPSGAKKKGGIDTKKTKWFSLSFCFGTEKMKAENFYWSEKDSFGRVYEGIEWNKGRRFGLEGSVVKFYLSRKGNSFSICPGDLGLSIVSFKSASSSVAFTDTNLVSNTVTSTSRYLPEEAFTIWRFVLSDNIKLGYRMMISPADAIEPYIGVGGQFDDVNLSGKELDDRGFSTVSKINLGFPFGVRLYRKHFFMGFEWNNTVKEWGWGGEMKYYDDPTSSSSKRETGILSWDGGSYWIAHLGFQF